MLCLYSNTVICFPATAFGKGVYFSTTFSYSEQGLYSPANTAGLKTIFLCRVLTGRYALGATEMVEPPLLACDTIERYNSVTNHLHRPQMFVIFHDAQVYPEYVLTFREV